MQRLNKKNIGGPFFSRPGENILNIPYLVIKKTPKPAASNIIKTMNKVKQIIYEKNQVSEVKEK